MGIPVVVTNVVAADGVSEVLITNIDDDAGYALYLIIPEEDADPSVVYFGNVDESNLLATGTITDNELRMTFDTPGEYAIRLDALDDRDPANPLQLRYWEARFYAS